MHAGEARRTEPPLHALRIRRLIQRAASICGGFAIVVGALVLAGWWWQLPRLTSVAPGLPSTVANAALMAALLGASLILSAPRTPSAAARRAAIAGKACAGVVAVIAGVTLLEHAFGLDLWLDHLLLSTGAPFIGRNPDRPSPQTAVACLLAATALLRMPAASARARRSSELLALASGIPPLMAALGYLFGAAALYGSTWLLSNTGMGIPTVVASLALSAGIAICGLDGGRLSILMKQDSGGTAARHLAAWLLVFVPVVCAIAIGARFGLYAAPFASALVVLAGTVVGSTFALHLSWRLSRLESKRRQTSEQLRQAHERFELALRGADLAAWDWNVESGEIIFNPRWAELRGYRPDELEPHVDTWRAGVHPEDWPRVEAALDDYFQGRVAEYDAELRVRTKLGQWIWVRDQGKVFARDELGRPIRMVGTELDITARKRLEHEQAFLAEIGSILASTLELEITLASIGRLATRALADICIVYLLELEHDVRRIEVVTRDPSQGWLRDYLVQHPMERRKAPAIWAEIEAHRSILLEQMPPEWIAAYAQDESHARALHAMNMSSAVMVPLVAHGKLVGALSLISSEPSRAYGPADVRFAEQIAQRAALAIENAQLYDQAQRAVQVRNEVLGVVAHDLHNPLGAILLQASLIREVGALLHPGVQKRAETIERSAQRMKRLIRDLLDVSRLENGHLPLEHARLAVAEVVGECVETQRPIAAESAVELRVDLAQDLPEIWADRDRLQQAFENLIGNAVKFSPPDGTIVVGAAPHEDGVLFRVADTGAGIAADDLPHVFDRFWQARRSGRSGAGLGLAIVKGIVEAHGGRIWVESTPDRGSTFFFTIPRAADATPPPAP